VALAPITRVAGTAVVLPGDDIDTDRIIPARFLKCVTFDDLAAGLFHDERFDEGGSPKGHPLDEPARAGASVIVTGDNFGCGSSREHAPQAIARWGEGIRVIVGESFAEIFYGNCQSLGIPCPTVDAATMEQLMSAVEQQPEAELTVDLETRTIRLGHASYPFTMPDGPRKAFLEGRWDSTVELLANEDAIRRTAQQLPYLRGYAS